MKHRLFHICTLLLLLMAGAEDVGAQATQKFSVVSFGLDPFDTAAQDDKYRKEDGDGELYAIFKVSSDNPDDKIEEYLFDFGNMNHLQQGVHGQELWLYVQRNAKHVTISRKGYATISKYGLSTVVEKGRTYRLRLSSTGPVVYSQWVHFSVTPADARAVVMAQLEEEQQPKMLGQTDSEGQLAKSLNYGRYNYSVLAEGYKTVEGAFTLNDETVTHQEQLTLTPLFSVITLKVDADAEIYVNNELKGRRTWTGRLDAGQYQVECRQEHHRSSSQSITVAENKAATISLAAPSPITGKLSISSQPLDATIQIDGRDYGKTPRNITNLLISSHEIVLSKQGYEPSRQVVEIEEGKTAEQSASLKKIEVATTTTSPATTVDNGGSSYNGADRTFTVKGVSFVMKAVEGGTFKMGSKGSSVEKPVHQVTLSDYMIGETEVTQALWKAVMGSNPSEYKGDNRPVENVSWYDCQTFIEELNSLTGKHFRLPTEAEWEYAARGGSKSCGYQYSGSNTLSDVAWFIDNNRSNIKTHNVKTKQANELGLYDMSGNVWEYCQDWWGAYSSNEQTNPTGPLSGGGRVRRGGCVYNDAKYCRVTYRYIGAPDPLRGLRLAL